MDRIKHYLHLGLSPGFLTATPIVLCCVAAVYLSAIGGTVRTDTERLIVLGLLVPSLILGAARAIQLSRQLREIRQEDEADGG